MMGIPMDAIFQHVHNCNMKKVSGIGPRGNKIDAIKPEGWVKPNGGIAKLLGDSLDK
jgi:predicted HAD superfamily Cof-like phosphohydrolase